MRKINKKGFSLIELIVAVAILILIVAVLVPQYRQSSIKAKEKADFASVESLETAVKLALQDTAYKASETEGETGQPINMYQLCKDAVANSIPISSEILYKGTRSGAFLSWTVIPKPTSFIPISRRVFRVV